jgi:hypothetical protein
MSKPPLYKIHVANQYGFGDKVAGAAVVGCLVRNGINAVFDTPKVHDLVDCPKIENIKNPEDYEILSHTLNRPYRKNPDYHFYSDLIKNFTNWTKKNTTHPIEQELHIDVDSVPVIYKEDSSIKGVDLVLGTKTGPWTKYKNWPYFDGLKKLLDDNNVSYIDVDKENIKGFEFLNYVKKSKAFLGLETGSSHYASALIRDSGYIIQSGFCLFDYWARSYNFTKIEHEVECRNCWLLGRGDGICQYDHKCMTRTTPDIVFNTIKHHLLD